MTAFLLRQSGKQRLRVASQLAEPFVERHRSLFTFHRENEGVLKAHTGLRFYLDKVVRNPKIRRGGSLRNEILGGNSG